MATQCNRSLNPGSMPHVGIIGAGVAGLRCADKLLKQGFKVTIIEGRERIGGRVHQTRIPGCGHLVDLGANWIHGTDGNPIMELAEKTESLTHSWELDSCIYDEDGNIIPSDEIGPISAALWETFILSAFEYSEKNSASIDPRTSLKDFLLQKSPEIFPGDDAAAIKKRKLLRQVADLWGAFVGGTLTRQSLKFFWLEECIEGENLFCASTYTKILYEIAKPALAKADIKFLTKATKITAAESLDSKLTIRTDWSEDLKFDEVVVTTPLGWLKQHHDAFEPQLPERFLQAIDALGYGCLEKVYISFPSAFWVKDKTEGESKPLTLQFLAPKYDQTHNPHGWNQEGFELASMPGPTAHPTLLFYFYGDQSRTISKALLERPSPADQEAYLLDFFTPYFSRLPNYDPALSECKPTGIQATNWLADDLAGNGSYTNFQIGLERGDEDVEVLREGLPDRKIWFAGEHTSPFEALGTVTGAYWSGEKVAERIISAYGLGEKGDDGKGERSKI